MFTIAVLSVWFSGLNVVKFITVDFQNLDRKNVDSGKFGPIIGGKKSFK